MDLLARREHSWFELERKLKLKGFAPEEIPRALDGLVRDGLLSDERFAEGYCRMRVNRGYGPRRIQQELLERGVSDTLITLVIAEYRQADWIELARSAWRKKFSGKLPREYKAWATQRRFLQYRGFTDEHCGWLSYENE